MMIVKFPNPILSEQMPAFDFENPIYDPEKLEYDMLDTMYSHGGIGLAANQVGIRTRVFVMGSREDPDNGMAFFNPEVIANTDNIEDLEEGCLSFPGIYVKIKRPTAIKARWQNSKGESMEGTFEGYECKCFLHELDHLEGITFKNRVSPLKWTMSVKKSKRK